MWNCGWGYQSGHGGWFTGHGLFGMVFGFMLLILVLFLVITVVRSLLSRDSDNKDKKDSLVILQEKLARGEISTEEYYRLRDILTG